MVWDGIHLASPTATNGQSLLGRTVVAHSLATNPIGMGATPPTDWDNEYNLDPRSATGSNGAAADIDGDGLSNLDESRHGTNPNSADTDSDGRSDSQETQNGSDPDTFDQPVPPGLMRLVRFRFGDPSGSLSEKYRLAVSGFDGRQFSSVNAGFNIVDGVDWQFRSGIRYAVSLHYLATKMSDGLMRPQPDYDCEVLIETDSTPNGLFQPNVTMGPGVNWRTAPNPSGEYFPITLRRNPANGLASLPPSTWIADNESHVLGQHWKPDFHNSKFEIQGKSAILMPVKIDIRQSTMPGDSFVAAESQEDDFAVVSSGTDADLSSELVITLKGAQVTANLKMNGSDGSLTFEESTMTITPGTPKAVKIWGMSASTGENTSKVDVDLVMPNGTIVTIQEDLTIIEGVEIGFEGNFYINVDTREFGRRPWDGRVDSKPNTKTGIGGINNYPSPGFPGGVQTLTGNTFYMDAHNGVRDFGYGVR